MSLLATGIAAGASVASAGINAYSQGSLNSRNRRFADRMYDKQRAHAVEDWHLQNAYNDPAAQMQRMKDAGLNPALVYGQGADAQSQAPVRSSSYSTPQTAAPQVDLGGAVYNALQARQMQSNIARTDAETAGIMARTQEQNYRNMAFTPELFARELETKIEAQASSAYSSRMSGDLSNVRADIADLEMQNQNLISGRVEGSDRKTQGKMSSQANMVYDKFQAEVQNVISHTQRNQATTINLELQQKLIKFEADLIETLGVNQAVAGQLLSNFMKLFLLKMR